MFIFIVDVLSFFEIGFIYVGLFKMILSVGFDILVIEMDDCIKNELFF